MKFAFIKTSVILVCVIMGLSATSCKKAAADEAKVIPFSHTTHVQNLKSSRFVTKFLLDHRNIIFFGNFL